MNVELYVIYLMDIPYTKLFYFIFIFGSEDVLSLYYYFGDYNSDLQGVIRLTRSCCLST
jgi:hypothetical protein